MRKNGRKRGDGETMTCRDTGPLLGKGLRLLFWVKVPMTIATIAGVVSFLGMFVLYRPALLTGAVCSAAYGLILMQLKAADARYHRAGICMLISAAGNGLAAPFAGSTFVWSFVIASAAYAALLVGAFYEFGAHAAVLSEVDRALAEKWKKLWRWCVGMFLGMEGSVVICLANAALGLLVGLCASIGSVVVSILRLGYLCRTAKRLRELPSGPAAAQSCIKGESEH